MIFVSIPASLATERRYGYKLLIESCLGFSAEIVELDNIDSVRITAGERVLDIHSEPTTKERLLCEEMPVNLIRESVLDPFEGQRTLLPALFSRQPANGKPILNIDADCSDIPFDMGLAAFYIASGLWESAAGEVDSRGRVNGKSSWLARVGMLDVPILEIYAKLLGRLLFEDKSIGAYSTRRGLRMNVTCDVDCPFDSALYEPVRIAKRLARNLALEHSVRAFRDTIVQVSGIRSTGWKADPNNQFDYMMTLNERHGFQLGFYFLCHRDDDIDASYDILSPNIQELLQRIVGRGHRIGIHGSYNSQYCPGMLRREVNVFYQAVERAGCQINTLEGRQHYLRWDTSRGPGIVAEAGINTDLSLGFHDCVGFRRGLCRPFPLFDLSAWRPTTVIERPLIAMECSLVGPDFRPISDPDPYLKIFSRAANWCRAVDGEFVLLWHNSFLRAPGQRGLYESLLAISK